ncbi:MAG: VOC family protein [Longimicrobiales bacterium]
MTENKNGVWFDHLVVGFRDLDEGAKAFEALTGVQPVFGGEHPALGTHNVLVSLGPNRYLEVLAPVPGRETHPMFQSVAGCETLTPVMWALATSDVAALNRRVLDAGFDAEEPWPGSRVTTDGDTLRWTMFKMGPGAPSNAPFFTEWDKATVHPSASTPTGCTLASLEITSPDDRELSRFFETIGFDSSVAAGPASIKVSLQTPNGLVTLGD